MAQAENTIQEICEQYITLLETRFEVKTELAKSNKEIKELEKKILDSFEVDGETVYATHNRTINLIEYEKKSKSLSQQKLLDLINGSDEYDPSVPLKDYLSTLYENIVTVEAKKLAIFPPFKKAKAAAVKKTVKEAADVGFNDDLVEESDVEDSDVEW